MRVEQSTKRPRASDEIEFTAMKLNHCALFFKIPSLSASSCWGLFFSYTTSWYPLNVSAHRDFVAWPFMNIPLMLVSDLSQPSNLGGYHPVLHCKYTANQSKPCSLRPQFDCPMNIFASPRLPAASPLSTTHFKGGA